MPRMKALLHTDPTKTQRHRQLRHTLFTIDTHERVQLQTHIQTNSEPLRNTKATTIRRREQGR